MKTEPKPKITKDTLPEDFTLLLALTDSLPVIFFGASMLLIGRKFSSLLFISGALLCLIGGTGKVLCYTHTFFIRTFWRNGSAM